MRLPKTEQGIARPSSCTFVCLNWVPSVGSTLLGCSEAKRNLNRSVPSTMFTAFRCYSGECITEEGFPVALLLSENDQLLSFKIFAQQQSKVSRSKDVQSINSTVYGG